MEKLKNSPYVYIAFLAAFCGWLLFGIFYSPEHPQIFFWGFVIIFVGVIVVYVSPTKKDAIILFAGIAALVIVGSLLHTYIPKDWNEFVKFLVNCVCLSPIYIPVYIHFIKMNIKSNNK